jgi:hypothetical protein
LFGIQQHIYIRFEFAKHFEGIWFLGVLDTKKNADFECESKAKKSQYKGVHLIKGGKWYARLCLNARDHGYGGVFNEEVDAAKRVNQLCE